MPAAAAVTKMMPPGTTIWWVPLSAAATAQDVLKVSLYNDGGAAKDISCAVVSGFTLNPTDSETDDTTTICDTAASNTPVRDAYEASLTFLREALKDDTGAPTSATSPAAVAFDLFKKGGVAANVTGWLVKRIGYKNTTAAKAGQLVSAFKVMPDNPQDEVGDGNQPIQMTVPFLPQGEMITNEPLTMGKSVALPVITSITPLNRKAGDTVTIHGHDFLGTVRVTATANAKTTDMARFEVLSDSEISAVLPAGAQTGNVIVTNNIGASSGFRYTTG